MSPRESPLAEQPARPQRPSGDAPQSRPQPIADAPKPLYRRPLMLLLAGIVLAAIIGGVVWWLDARRYESTDDAFIDARTLSIS